MISQENKKTAFITGINGQDGSYLAEFLVSKNYNVIGMVRRQSVAENQSVRIAKLRDNNLITLEYGDMTDFSSLMRIIKKHNPDEIYNLAAQSHVRVSFDLPQYTSEVVGLGVINLLEAVKLHNKNIKIYQASSSEMFGNSIDEDGFQREETPMRPVSPYGCAKVFAYNICNNYKNSYNMFISNGILFNHESPRRGITFVTNKVVKGAVDIKCGYKNSLYIGNRNATRDWGHAKDYVKAMWMILQLDKPDNFVCATGVSHSVQDLIEYTFSKLDLDWSHYVKQDIKYMRPEELNNLKGDSSKLQKATGWQPEYTFETMLDEMIDYWR